VQIDGIVSIDVSPSPAGSCPARRILANPDTGIEAAEERGLLLPAERRAATDNSNAAVLLDCSARAWADITIGLGLLGSITFVSPIPLYIYIYI
jgi:hypothetical protein